MEQPSVFRGGVAGHGVMATYPLARIALSFQRLEVRASAVSWRPFLRVERAEALGIQAASRNQWTFVDDAPVAATAEPVAS